MRKYYWTMANGQQIDVDHMDITHLRNTLKMILRNVEAKRAQEASRKKHHIQLNGDIAQDHLDMMMDKEWADDMNYHQGL
jgi:mannitol-specific phosphotransferase system IIBC component